MAKQAAKRIAKQAVKQAANACLTAGPICWVPVLCVLLVLLAAIGTAAAVVVTFVGSEISQLGASTGDDAPPAALTAAGLELPDHVEPQNWRLPAQMLSVSDGWTALSKGSLKQALEAAAERSEAIREEAHEEALAAAELDPPPLTVTAPPDEPELWDPGPGHDACAAAASLARESARWETPELIGENGSLPGAREYAEALNASAGRGWCQSVVAAKIVWENAPPIVETDTVGACAESCARLVDVDGNSRLVALPSPRLRDWAKKVLPLAIPVQEAPFTVWGRMDGEGPQLCAHQPLSLLGDETKEIAAEIDEIPAKYRPNGRILLRLRMPCQEPPEVCVPQPPPKNDEEAEQIAAALLATGCVSNLDDWDPPHPGPPPRRPPFGPLALVGRDAWIREERTINAAPGMLMLVGAAHDIGVFELTDRQRTVLAGMVTASQDPFGDAPDVTVAHWEQLLKATYGASEEELAGGWMGRTDTQGRELGLCHWLPRLVAGASCAEGSPLATRALRVLWGGYGTTYRPGGAVGPTVPIPGYVPGEGCPDVPPAPWGDLDTNDASRLVAIPDSWRNPATPGPTYVSPCLIELLAALIAESEESMPGGPLRIVSGYRNVALQETLYVTRGCSPGAGCLWGPLTARPGYSMHHTGQAVDFNVPTEGERFQWLAARLPQHGLVPLTSGSGEVIEPWHWSTNSR